jgi:hypothetical protein
MIASNALMLDESRRLHSVVALFRAGWMALHLLPEESHAGNRAMNPPLRMRNLLPVLIFGFCWLGAGQTIPPWFPKTPPLSPPHGEVIRVGITDELLAAATGALEQGVPLAEVIEDIRGRPRTGSPDLGAWQSERETNFTNGSASAKKFGTHEIVLMGQGNVANPFDTAVTVKFTPPSGSANAVAVDAFYDGGNAWRARMYVTEAGRWKWISTSATDRLLDRQSGTFLALPSNLRGRLRKHQANPRAWMTEDGRWFANISDTGYRLFHAQAAPLWQEFIRNSAAQGITCMRAACLGG